MSDAKIRKAERVYRGDPSSENRWLWMKELSRDEKLFSDEIELEPGDAIVFLTILGQYPVSHITQKYEGIVDFTIKEDSRRFPEERASVNVFKVGIIKKGIESKHRKINHHVMMWRDLTHGVPIRSSILEINGIPVQSKFEAGTRRNSDEKTRRLERIYRLDPAKENRHAWMKALSREGRLFSDEILLEEGDEIKVWRFRGALEFSGTVWEVGDPDLDEYRAVISPGGWRVNVHDVGVYYDDLILEINDIQVQSK